MFVWVARDKGSEWKTLDGFQRKGALPFHPLIEAVCEPFISQRGRPANSPEEGMGKLAARLSTLADSGRVWLDVDNLTAIFSPRDVAGMLRTVQQSLGLSRQLIVPVVRCSSPPPIINAAIRWAQSEKSGLCIRVDGVTDLTDKPSTVEAIARESGIAPAEIDLIADARNRPTATSHEALSLALPLAERSRTWAVIAGSFPSSITHLSPDVYEHTLERPEWSAFVEEMKHYAPYRRPLYGDYATQAAIYKPSPGFAASPSVRYTTSGGFVVVRGRGGPNAPGGQYIGHARFLMSREYFREGVTTAGDDYAARIAAGDQGPGNATTWRVASLQRHVELVASQVAALQPAYGNGRARS